MPDLAESLDTELNQAIMQSATDVKTRIIELHDRHINIATASRASRWLLTRKPLPEVRFGYEDADNISPVRSTERGLFTTTAPLLVDKEGLPDGSEVSFGWIFQLESPMPEAVLKFPDTPMHAFARFGRSDLSVFKAELGEEETREKWFRINLEDEKVSCYKLAQVRESIFPRSVSLNIPPGLNRSEQLDFIRRTDSTPVVDAMLEQYRPGEVTMLRLDGILQGALRELA